MANFRVHFMSGTGQAKQLDDDHTLSYGPIPAHDPVDVEAREIRTTATNGAGLIVECYLGSDPGPGCVFAHVLYVERLQDPTPKGRTLGEAWVSGNATHFKSAETR